MKSRIPETKGRDIFNKILWEEFPELKDMSFQIETVH